MRQRPALPQMLLAPVELFARRKGTLGHGGKMFDRITFDPKILGGRACIRGLRIPVAILVNQIAHGAAQEDLLRDYPDLEAADLGQAMEYAAWLTQEEVHPAR